MRPAKELASLRYNAQKLADASVKADAEVPLKGVSGDSIEISLDITGGAKQFGVKVCCSPDGKEQTLVYYDAADKKLKVDTRKSSLGEGPKKIEAAPFELKADEPLKLRIFVDKSVVEVFANDRQAIARRIYPTGKKSTAVKLFANGGAIKASNIQAWDMMPSNQH
jgi:beta-fructofuranosidase